MTAASALGGTELFAGVQSGGNVKITASQIATFAGSGLTVGTTTIAGGTTTRILYDNTGVLGEYTLTGSGTVVAMQTSPSFTTPTLGVAVATSINKVAITAPATSATLTIADGKTATHNASTTFAGTDGKTLTVSNSGTLAGGDAFVLAIAAGKTLTVSNSITFAGTDATTMTFPSTSATIPGLEVANVFTSAIQTVSAASGTSPGWYSQITGDTTPRVRVGVNASDVASVAFGPGNAVRDLFLERMAAASLRMGTADAATAVAQTLTVQSVLAGTTDTAGGTFTISGSKSTGTGAAGTIVFQTASAAASTGSGQNAVATLLTLGPSTVFGTSNVPAFNLVQTWNNASLSSPTAFLMNVTNTNSTGTPLICDWQIGGVSQFKVSSAGAATAAGLATATGGFSSGSNAVMTAGGDTFLRRNAAANWQLGTANAAAPVAQILSTQGSRSGTDTNVGGANMTHRSGIGTGTGTLSSLILQSPIAVASGTGAQTSTTGLTILNGTAVLSNYTVAALPSASTSGAGATAFVTDASTTLILGLGLAVTGGGANKVPVYSDGTSWLYG